jgi:hypothetical protein
VGEIAGLYKTSTRSTDTAPASNGVRCRGAGALVAPNAIPASDTTVAPCKCNGNAHGNLTHFIRWASMSRDVGRYRFEHPMHRLQQRHSNHTPRGAASSHEFRDECELRSQHRAGASAPQTSTAWLKRRDRGRLLRRVWDQLSDRAGAHHIGIIDPTGHGQGDVGSRSAISIGMGNGRACGKNANVKHASTMRLAHESRARSHLWHTFETRNEGRADADVEQETRGRPIWAARRQICRAGLQSPRE